MSQDEIVDIVNQNDEVIGCVSKIEAHKLGLLHRTVIGMVVGSDGRWTLSINASHKQDPGQLVSPIGGHVSSGETEDQALEREALEEYGLTEGEYKYKLIGKAIYDRHVIGRHENHYFIFYEIYTDKKPILNDESSGTVIMSVNQMQAEIKNMPKKFGNALHFVLSSFYPNFL
jgi:isopentenyl-diphosphate delta-isomerase